MQQGARWLGYERVALVQPAQLIDAVALTPQFQRYRAARLAPRDPPSSSG